MAITDKTRKMLWGKSGNRCAICKHELVVGATPQDDASVVADECHIISSRPEGPRYDTSFPTEYIDAYQNLILLCRTHHKMVDDQTATFTSDILRQMKSNHEVWVSDKLGDQMHPKPIKIHRIKKNIPSFLVRLATGKEVLDLVSNAMASSFDHDDLSTQREVDLVGGFLQSVQDWADLSEDLEAHDRVQAAYTLTQSLLELEENGFLVFGAREVQILEGGVQPEPSNWPISIIRILRHDNHEILHEKLDEDKEQNPNKAINRDKE